MHFLPPAVEAYAEANTEPEPTYLAELYRASHLKTLFPRMVSGHWQGRLLSMIAKLLAPQLIVEVGTYTGYAALCLSEGLAPGGKLITIERDAELAHFAAPYLALVPAITQWVGPALALLPQVPPTVDLAFVDAAKEEYQAYYDLLLPKLRPGGLLVTDNVLWSGQVVDNSFTDARTQALRSFNSFVANDPRVEKVLLPVRDGLTLIRKR